MFPELMVSTFVTKIFTYTTTLYLRHSGKSMVGILFKDYKSCWQISRRVRKYFLFYLLILWYLFLVLLGIHQLTGEVRLVVLTCSFSSLSSSFFVTFYVLVVQLILNSDNLLMKNRQAHTLNKNHHQAATSPLGPKKAIFPSIWQWRPPTNLR